jgi:hypothetical protein
VSDRAIRAITGTAATFGLGSLVAIPIVWIVGAIARDIDTARLVAIAAGIGYPVAAGILFYLDGQVRE